MKKTFGQLLVTHGSETLAGMRCAALICLKNLEGDMDCVVTALRDKGLEFFHITGRTGCPLVLVYRPDKLEKALEDEGASRILSKAGYSGSLHTKLEQLGKRFAETDCPHEVGLFLGYPSLDVLSFIENGGRNFIFQGLWKVYHDEDGAKKAFRKFEKCRQAYISLLAEGTDIARLCITAAQGETT